MLAILVAALLAAEPELRPLWQAQATVSKGGDQTFHAQGTRKGVRYRFHARGICQWEPKQLVDEYGTPFTVQRREGIFGIEFRVTFGGQEHRFLDVGANQANETELEFVADSDDVAIRINDAFELPKEVNCTIDGISVWPSRGH